MSNSIEQSIDRVIVAMHENLGERITIDDMAQIAMFSKFHFSRAFRVSTGMSPAKFLSALRLQTAMQLLVSTSLSIAEISHQVGYTSVGTFSWRFKSSVGVPPTVFRAHGGRSPRPRRMLSKGSMATIRGRVTATDPRHDSGVYLGLFPDLVAEGAPVRCTFLDKPGPFELEHVPAGTWHVMAYTAPPPRPTNSDGLPQTSFQSAIAARGPLHIRPESVLALDLQLRPARPTDPPVLIAPAGTQFQPAAAKVG